MPVNFDSGPPPPKAPKKPQVIRLDPHPGPQTFALSLTQPSCKTYYREILYGGARGAGKSFAQILFLLCPAVRTNPDGSLMYPNYRGLLIRRNADDLRVLIDDAWKIYKPCGAKRTGQQVVFEFPGGPKIFTGHLQYEHSFEDYQGHEYHKIGIDEITQIPSLNRYLALLGSLRNSPDGRPQVFLTGNPGNAGDGWVRKRFVKVPTVGGGYSKPLDTLWDPVQEAHRIFVPARVYDNPTIMQNDPGYVKNLEGLSEHRKRAWLYGDWDAFEGQAFEDFRPGGPYADEPEWANHVIDPMEIPSYCHRWLSMDWGHTHYGACYKYANMPNGQVHVYGEMVRRKQGSVAWGAEIAKWCLPELQASQRLTLHLSRDAFAKRDETHTQAEGIMAGIKSVLGDNAAVLVAPSPEEKRLASMDPNLAAQSFERRSRDLQSTVGIAIKPAAQNRLAAANYIRELMRFRPTPRATGEPDTAFARSLMNSGQIHLYDKYMSGYREADVETLPKLQIHKSCPRLIESLQSMVLDPDRPEDILKRDATETDMGDDEYDSFGMGALAHQELVNSPPKQMVMAAKMESARARGVTDPTLLMQMLRHAESQYDGDNQSQRPVRLGRLAVPRQQTMGGLHL